MTEPQAKILIVDDEPANIELIADIFAHDHEVLFAMNGTQALKMASAALPEVILLDIVLPGMDGFEVCAQLKADPLTQSIPVLFITGLGDGGAETKGLALGAMDYITKPINPAVVRLRVTNHIALRQAQQQLARLATIDGLTGLANRRRFDDVLAWEHARCVRRNEYLGLILLDIDYFKLFNDSYGHVYGDDCLRTVAGVLAQSVKRTTDLAARYGGEEFVCILPSNPSDSGVVNVAERIRQGVIDLNIPHSRSRCAAHVTVSLGAVNLLCTQGSSPVLLLALADQQLYRAKSAGRNRLCFSGDVD